MLAQFAYGPAAPRHKTAETKALAAVKARETRKARHTMGVRQKKQIKGEAAAELIVADAPASATNGATNGAANGTT